MNYWLKHFDSNVSESPTNLLKQVGKTVNGVEVDKQQIGFIVDAICDGLSLDNKSKVVDLCCGNGLLTVKIADKCNSVIGVDYSSLLIKTANKFNKNNKINYINSDVTTLDPVVFQECDAVYMYEGLQHITKDNLSKVMELISVNPNINKFFIGGVPDKSLIEKYYNTDEKMEYYQTCENNGTPHLGKWWDKSEIKNIGKEFGFNLKIKDQNEKLYSSYYRFDCLLERI